jgi:hypothetical protein
LGCEAPQVLEQRLVVDDSRHLVLATELAMLLHPGSERIATDGDDFWWPQAESTRPVRTIVVIRAA